MSLNYSKLFSRLLMVGSIAGALSLTACALDTPTNVTQNKIQLTRDSYSQKFVADAIGAGEMAAISDHYRSAGYGPVDLVISYDPRSTRNTAMHATEQAGRIAAGLKARRVPVKGADIMPVQGLGDQAVLLLSYDTVAAHAPKGCGVMGGLDGKPVGIDPDYKTGCTMDSLIARQIANPKDLAGREDLGARQARPYITAVEGRQTGEALEPIDGYSTSGE